MTKIEKQDRDSQTKRKIDGGWEREEDEKSHVSLVSLFPVRF